MKGPSPSPELDLADIQGNVLTAYGKLGFPKGRFLVLNVRDAAAGRGLVATLRPRVTTAMRWPSHRKGIPTRRLAVERPKVALNIAFTFYGLLALGIPIRTLRYFPDDFIDGMFSRARILGDDFPRQPQGCWDQVWLDEGDRARRVHILITLNAQITETGEAVAELDAITREIERSCASSEGKLVLLTGHRGADERYQELSALFGPALDGRPQPLPREHFGFFDGIGDPVFKGQHDPDTEARRVLGNGKIGGDGVWQPLATGEFLLGYPDEAQEIAGQPMPFAFSRNGTFFAYRKLHQNAAAFRGYIDRAAQVFGRVFNIPDPVEARETLLAKFAGRWSDGVPLTVAPSFAKWEEFNTRLPANSKDRAAQAQRERALSDFTFHDDPAGIRCPLGAHIRRGNTRDMLDPITKPGAAFAPNGSVLNNRRRILRRGLPYGVAPNDAANDDGEHGIIMLNICANLSRQFEFVQQQWMNYGLDFNAGNDTCPIIGIHREGAKFIVPADPESGHGPFIADAIPQFVETRGGGYFFLPSMTALNMIGMGVVDPT